MKIAAFQVVGKPATRILRNTPLKEKL